MPKGCKNIKLFVMLESVPNPDHGQTRKPSKAKTVKVKTLRNASEVCLAYIAEHELGGGNFSGGAVTDEQKRFVARISYNGRVWSSDDLDKYETRFHVRCEKCGWTGEREWQPCGCKDPCDHSGFDSCIECSGRLQPIARETT